MTAGGGCLSGGWSIISSASNNSQLAGVLAGFIITAVTILLGRSEKKTSRAFGLLCASFVVLGFDSYLFSLVSGGNSDPYCARVWSEGMPASGMLAVGGLAVVTSITWMLGDHLGTSDQAAAGTKDDASARAAMYRIARFTAHGVAVSVTLLLTTTTFDYLGIVYPVRTPPIWLYTVAASPAIVAIASISLSTYRAKNPETELTRKISSVSLGTASYGVLAYAVAGPLFAGIITTLPSGTWPHLTPFLATISICLGVFIPSILLIALVQSISPGSPSSKQEELESNSQGLAGPSPRTASLGVPAEAQVARQQETAPRPKLDMEWLTSRRDGYLKDHYLGMHVTIVSVALATAGVTAASLISSSAAGIHAGILWILWADGLLVVAAAYSGTMVGAFALPPSLPSILDLVLPLAMAVTEFLLFAILIAQLTQPHMKFSTEVNAWLILMLIFLSVAAASILRARHLFANAINGQLYTSEAEAIIAKYIGGLRADLLGIFAIFSVVTLAVIVGTVGADQSWILYLVGILIGAGAAFSLSSHAKAVRIWQSSLQ